jgi:hypothetical protein
MPQNPLNDIAVVDEGDDAQGAAAAAALERVDFVDFKNSIDGTATAEERSMRSAEVQALKDKAFEMLVDEKLAADESFSIFITLSNDVLQQLRATRSRI